MALHNTWNTKHEMAAQLVADDNLTAKEIAAEVGISYSQLHEWKDKAIFQSRVREIISQRLKIMEQHILNDGIARRANRVAQRQDMLDRLKLIVDERAADPEMQDVPGGRSGLIVAMHHKNGEITYVTDTALVSKMESLMVDSAKDVGQWVQKTESVGALDTLRAALETIKYSPENNIVSNDVNDYNSDSGNDSLDSDDSDIW